MRVALIKSALAGAAFASLALFLPAGAQHRGHDHQHATGVVKERMEAMDQLAKTMKAIDERIKANRELDAIKADADHIRELAAQMPALFPPASNQHPSAAKAIVWQKWSGFEAKAAALAAASAKLAQADARDVKAVAAQVRAVSQACGACHEIYRSKQHSHSHKMEN